MSYVGVPILMDDAGKAERMATAILNSLDTWISQAEEIEAYAIPFTGNKSRALHLQRSMLAARQTLRNIAGLPEEDSPFIGSP